jgi:energy-converting hydrogenase Eha subunit G
VYLLVLGPFVLGLVVLFALFDLGPAAWAFVLTVAIGGLAMLVIVGARLSLLGKQAEGVDDASADVEVDVDSGPE